jgi:hypothetical protein
MLHTEFLELNVGNRVFLELNVGNMVFLELKVGDSTRPLQLKSLAHLHKQVTYKK